METSKALLSIALDLTAALTASDRYERLLAVVRGSIPCDAASIMKVEADGLVILAAHGLVPEALGHRYSRHENPRLDVILGSLEPVVFTADSALPDPFDGLIAGDEEADLRHSNGMSKAASGNQTDHPVAARLGCSGGCDA